MSQTFMRNAFITQDKINSEQQITGQVVRAHCELYVPTAASYRAHVRKIWISMSGGATVCVRGGPMMPDASHSESRGLPITDGAQRPYSDAHARLHAKPGQEYEGGQLWNHEGLKDELVELELPVILGQGNSLFVRSNLYSKPLYVSFLWDEVAI